MSRMLTAALLALFLRTGAAGEPAHPEILPPPPELLEEAGQAAPPDPAAPDDEYAPRIVYTAPDPVDPALAPRAVSAAIPVQGGGFVSRGLIMSQPASSMPPDYFNLPLNEDSIPGVLLPELDDDGPGSAGLPDQAASAPPGPTGLSLRQLEPFFALAKGGEGEALDARKRGDEHVYLDQLGKARDAYMSIVAMADAGSEAREEAWYGVARCEYRLGNWWRSFEALERSFPEEYQAGEVAGRMKLEAFIGERLWGYGREPAPDARVGAALLDGYRAAARVYRAIMFNQPINDDAPLALLRQGDAAGFYGEWEEAIGHYRQVIDYFPDSEQAMQARSSLAEAIYRQEWPTGMPEAARNDARSVMEDVERVDEGLSTEASDRRMRAVGIANDLDAEIKLRHAREYLNSVKLRKSRAGAVFLLKDVVSLYPGSRQASEASDILVSLGETPPSGGERIHSPFAPDVYPADADGVSGGAPFGEAQATLEIPSDIPDFTLPASPSRETVYESLPDPTPAQSF